MTRFGVLSVGVVLALGWLAAMAIYFSVLPGWRSLDFLMTTGQIERALARWDVADRAYHLRGTQTLDLIFPTLYGVVLSFVVWRYWQGRWRALLLVLTWGAVAADYTENYYSVRLLTGQSGIWPHLVATWVKFAAITWPMDAGLIRWFGEVRRTRG